MKLSAIVFSCAIAAAPCAQDKHVRVLSRFNPGGGLSDCWGYATGTGGEYALLGGTAGTWVVDCSDPTKPRARGFIPATASGWQPSPWRDIKTYRSFAYVVTEGGGGMQIIDLRDPNQPKLVTTWGKTRWTNAHNLQIDTATGIAYVCGTSRGTHIVDLRSDPTRPRHLAVFEPSRYIHDLHVQNGRAHMADLRNNRYLIVDVTKLPQTTILSATAGAGSRILHNAWVDRDDQIAVTTNEVPSGPLGVYDVRDPRRPKLLAQTRIGPAPAIIHNAHLQNRLAHVSYYTEGYQLFDLTDPSKPVHVGSYDTFPGASGGFNGAWGCYPFQPSGVVYVSDLRSGLWVFAARAVALPYGPATTPTGGRAPVLRAIGASYVGNARFTLEVETRANARGVLVIGERRAKSDLLGLKLNVDLSPPAPFTVPFTADAEGLARVALPIPNDRKLDGKLLFLQCAVLDPKGPLGLAASRGLAVDVFAR